MDYKKYCEEAYLKDPPLSDIPVVYLPCPHKCYKRKVINRATLTHDQHTALLATPKGFYWDKNTGLAVPPKRATDEESNGEPKNLVRCTFDQRYVYDFISNVWNTMTPKYRRKLERILIRDFKMSQKQAKEFIKEQKLRNAFSQRRTMSKVNLSERHEWVKEMADTLADKVTAYVAEMLSARRTRKVQAMAEAILGGFGDLTGERCDFNKPKNKIQKMQVFASDRLAVWLSRILGDYEEELCRDILDVPDTDSSDDEDQARDQEKKEETEKSDDKPKPKPEEPKAPEEPKPEEPKPEEPKPEEPKPEEPKPEEPKPLEEPESEESKPPEEPKPVEPKPDEPVESLGPGESMEPI